MNYVSTTRIVTQGILVVQLPILIIILSFYGLGLILHDSNSKGGLLVGAVLGWFYWEFAVKKWVSWALDLEVDPARLLKIGRYSLILWNGSQIEAELRKRNSI